MRTARCSWVVDHSPVRVARRRSAELADGDEVVVIDSVAFDRAQVRLSGTAALAAASGHPSAAAGGGDGYDDHREEGPNNGERSRRRSKAWPPLDASYGVAVHGRGRPAEFSQLQVGRPAWVVPSGDEAERCIKVTPIAK